MYRRAGVLWREGISDGNPWGVRFLRMFDMANDSVLFRTRAELASAGWRLDAARFEKDGEVVLPLYEAKMIHQFDHRFGSYEVQSEAQANQGKLPELDHIAHADPGRTTLSRYWVHEDEVATRLEHTWDRHWLLGWRDIARASDIRTVISCIVPPGGGQSHVPTDDDVFRSATRDQPLRESVQHSVRLLRAAEGRRNSLDVLHHAAASCIPTPDVRDACALGTIDTGS